MTYEPQNIYESQNITDKETGAYEPALDAEAPAATDAASAAGEAPIDDDEAPADEAAIRFVPAADSGSASGGAGLPGKAVPSEDQRWHDILVSFVDDPRSSLKAATEVVREDASAFVALLGRWQESLPGAAPDDRDAETEKMRQALVIYRDVSRQLVTSMRSLG